MESFVELIILRILPLDESEPADVFEMDDLDRLSLYIQNNFDIGQKFELEYTLMKQSEYDKICELSDEE